MIGLFTGLDPATGGVEASAAAAWAAVRAFGPSQAVVYRPSGPAGDEPGMITVRSKFGLAAALLRRTWPADGLLCWHLSLLQTLPLLRRFRGRVVAFVHGIESWRPQSRLTRRMLSRVDHFLSNTQYTWDRFLTYQPQLADARHTVVPLGIGDPLAGPTPPPGPVPAAVILGRMARGEDYKGHRELITAWPRVRERLPDAELWIAGDGDLRPDLEALAREVGIAGAVRFFGRVTEEQKQDLLARSRCLTMPSRGEGFGLVYLEAMRIGRPCLVSDQDAGREVVNPPETGLAANPSNPAALAVAVAELLTPGPRWDEWSRAARERYETQFTAAQFQRRLLAAVTGPPTLGLTS